MPTYSIQGPDGRTYSIEGPAGATREQVIAEVQRQNGGKIGAAKPDAGKDIGKSLVTGAVKGIVGLAQQADATTPTGIARNLVSRFTGAPTPGDQANNLVSRYAHKPETRAGRYAEAVGEAVPNALAPGGVIRRGLSVVAPGLAGEAAREGAEAMGGNELAQAGAKLAGNLLGGVGASARLTRPNALAPVVPPKPPTLPELTKSRKAAYKDVEASGHRYSAESFADMVSGIKTRLAKEGYDPDFHDPARKMVAKLEGKVARGEAPTLAELDKLRSFARKNVEKVGDGEQRRVGGVIGRGIDEFIDSQGGDAAALVGKARDLYKRELKVAGVTKALKKSERAASKSGSGGNYDNATRQKMDQILEKNAYLTDDERAALDNIVMGDRGQNILRAYGKTSPLAGGLPAQVNAIGGVLTLGASGLLHSAPSSVAKIAADNITRTKVKNLINLMAAGGTKEQLLEIQQQAKAIKGPAGTALQKMVAARLKDSVDWRVPALIGAAAGASAARPERRE